MKKKKTPWPTKAVMDQIYEQKLWGGKSFDFYSGSGSHNPEIISPYIAHISQFLKTHSNLVVCDLGCGDFNIGKHFTQYTYQYHAIDIVETLINRNKKIYHKDNLEFYCLDISKDELPPGDCVLIRQVLQHISNAEIKRVLKKIVTYKYIIVTEHLPTGNFTANKDIISSQGIRLKKNSGINLQKEPFNLKPKTTRNIDKHILKQDKGIIQTTLYTMF